MSKMGNSPAVLGVDEGISYLGLPYSKESASKNNKMNNRIQQKLASYPLFLFTEKRMRNGTKTSFIQHLHHLLKTSAQDTAFTVVDCGYLLQQVIWHRNDSVRAIEVVYVSYVLNTKEVGNVGTKMLWNIYGGDEGTLNTLPE